jgi:hypothetical protein
VSRGPRSARALEAAVPVAWLRGEVMVFGQRNGSCFDFMISGPAGQAAIHTERAKRIHGSAAEIALAHAGTIDRMYAAALASGVSRELWLWAPWGRMRFFRLDGPAIVELDLLGNVRLPLVKGALAGKKRERKRKSIKKSGTASSLPAPGPEPLGAGTRVPGTKPEPAPVRYLKRRAAELKKSLAGGPGTAMTCKPVPPLAGVVAPAGDDDPPS